MQVKLFIFPWGELFIAYKSMILLSLRGSFLLIFYRHTVMVANSKSDAYTKLNFQGRPVMDKLAEDMLRDVLKFE